MEIKHKEKDKIINDVHNQIKITNISSNDNAQINRISDTKIKNIFFIS